MGGWRWGQRPPPLPPPAAVQGLYAADGRDGRERGALGRAAARRPPSPLPTRPPPPDPPAMGVPPSSPSDPVPLPCTRPRSPVAAAGPPSPPAPLPPPSTTPGTGPRWGSAAAAALGGGGGGRRWWHHAAPLTLHPAGVVAIVVAVLVAAAVLAVAAWRKGKTLTPLYTLPFPVASGVASAGGFPTLCSLQCVLLGGSPTSIEVGNSSFEVSPTVCANNLETARLRDEAGQDNAETVKRLDRSLEGRLQRISKALGSPREQAIGTDVRYVFSQTPLPVPCAAAGARDDPVGSGWSSRPGPRWVSLLAGGAHGGGGERLAYEADISRALTLQRNTAHGSVSRIVNRYDVLGVTSVAVGVRMGGHSFPTVAALDHTRRSSVFENELQDPKDRSGTGKKRGDRKRMVRNVPIIVRHQPGGRKVPVSISQRNLLSLGRGLLADTRWLGSNACTWNLDGRVDLRKGGSVSHFWFLNGSGVAEIMPGQADENSPIHTDAATTTPWLAHIATILCSGDAAAFVRDASLCDSVVHQDNVADTAADGSQLPLMVQWSITPEVPYQADLRHDDGVWGDDSHNRWRHQVVDDFTFRGRRELNPHSPDEARLAETLRQQQLDVYVHPYASWNNTEYQDAVLWNAWFQPTALWDDLVSMSNTYRAEVFHVEPPDDPMTTSALFLAISVVLPELAAVIALYTSTRAWGGQRFKAVVTLCVMGFIAVGGLTALSIAEVRGARWRAISIRSGLVAAIPKQLRVTNSYDDGRRRLLDGTVVQHWETVLVIARTGYRPRLVVGCTGVVAFVFVVVVCAVLHKGFNHPTEAGSPADPASHPRGADPVSV